jgi:hypothetical protein
MRKIGIVGADIRFDDLMERSEGYELWSCNNLYGAFDGKHFDRWFELHDIERRGKRYTRRGISYYPISSEKTVREYLLDLNDLKCPVYMQKQWGIIKQSMAFPFDEIMEKWGQYFGCSFAWMMAMAIDEKPDAIGIWGMNFGAQEYWYQRPSLEYMIGYARGLGIPVHIDEDSQLLKEHYVYAIEENYDLIYLLHGQMAVDVAKSVTTAVQDRLTNFFYSPYWRSRE